MCIRDRYVPTNVRAVTPLFVNQWESRYTSLCQPMGEQVHQSVSTNGRALKGKGRGKVVVEGPKVRVRAPPHKKSLYFSFVLEGFNIK